jgi:DNA-binding CsgD family transcriptional regulator
VSTSGGCSHDRLLRALHLLLGLDVTDLERALDAAARQIADAMQADKVDVFLLEPTTATLVAVGTNDSPMARMQKALGLDRLPLEHGGTSAFVFQHGQSRLSGNLDRDPIELRGIVDDLGVRSQIAVPLDVRGERRGVVMVCSAAREYFSEDDLRFVETIASWVGLVGYRAAAVQHAVAAAALEGLRVAAEDTVGKLTPRQREVAKLVASGLTNMEIAERLVLTPGTVANHVESILRRLDFRSRTQVAALLGDPSLGQPRTEAQPQTEAQPRSERR